MDRLTVLPGYESLASVLDEALAQAQSGKGKERHASGEAFEDQQICEIAARTGDGGPIFQLVKKAYESQRLEGERGDAELLGTINYAVAAILERRRRRLNKVAEHLRAPNLEKLLSPRPLLLVGETGEEACYA